MQYFLYIAMKALLSRFNQPVQPVIAVISIGIVFLVGALVYMMSLFSRFNFFPKSPPKMTHVYAPIIPYSTMAPHVPTVTIYQHTFASPDLGISFDYSDTDIQPVHVEEVDDKVYLNVSQEKPPLGKYVEVLPKDPNDTLTQAVQKAVLQGYSLQNCQVISKLRQGLSLPHATYQYGQLKVVGWDTMSISDVEYKAKQYCPGEYTSVNSIKYFVTDTQHPNKLLFFDIGQDNITGKPTTVNGKITTWDETISFYK